MRVRGGRMMVRCGRKSMNGAYSKSPGSSDELRLVEKIESAAACRDFANLGLLLNVLDELLLSEDEVQYSDDGPHLYFIQLVTALRQAIAREDIEITRCLLDSGLVPVLGVFIPDCARLASSYDFLELLTLHGLNFHTTYTSYRPSPPIWYALMPDHLITLGHCISLGANANYHDIFCRSPLDMAAEIGSISSFKFLLEHGAKVERSDALLSAAGSDAGHSEQDIMAMLDYLLTEVKIDPNANGIFVKVGRLMLNHDYDEERTPLQRAIVARKHERIVFLLEHGANPLFQDYKGRTAIDFARDMGERWSECNNWLKQEVHFLEQWVKDRVRENVADDS